jgi:polygalacturonase
MKYIVHSDMNKAYTKLLLCLCCLLGNQFTLFATDINILSTGALADGKTLNSIAIQTAIDECSKSGGGKVIVPKGVFITGQLTFHSNIELHLQAGAVLKGSTNIKHYPNRSFIIAKGCNDIQITGTGTIDGSGEAFYDANFQPLKRPQPFILFDSCRFIKLRDFKLINSPSHGFRIFNSAEVVVDRIYMNFAERSPNTDGIDIVDTRNVYISNSTFITGDDAICLKSHAGKVENVTVTNCYIQSDDGGIKLGTGSADTIQHCSFSNIVIRNTRFALAMFMQEGGVYRFINFSNINIQNGGRQKNVYPIYIDVDKKTAAGKLGLIEYINFNNLQIETRGNILIAGQPSAPLQNITLSNITMLVQNCDDVSKYKKPRGNRSLPVFADTKDLSAIAAHITLGFIQNLRWHEVQVIDNCISPKRKIFYKEKVTEIK